MSKQLQTVEKKTQRAERVERTDGLVDRVKNALRLDGWANILTGIGVWGRDKRMAAHVKWERMTREEQEHIYAADELARKLIDMIPDEAMEKGYKVTGLSDEQEEALKARLANLRFDEIFNQAWKNDRIHGGAGIFKVCADGGMDTKMPDKPIVALNLMTKWELFVWTSNIESDVTSPHFGEPVMYQLQLTEGQKTYSEPLHHSRIVRFPGTYLPRQLRKQNNYWGDSELNRLKNVISNYSQAHDSIAAAILDFSIPVLKMKDLAGKVGANSDDYVIRRLEIVNMAKGIARMILIDADKEEFTHATRQVTGLPELVDRVEGRVATAYGAPRTKLFNVSPKGMGGEGGHEETNWYDYLKSQQNNYLKPRMLEIIRHIVKTEPPFAGTVDPAKVDMEFNPLWQLDEVDQSKVRLAQAQTDQIYIETQVIDPTEVAGSRFGSGKYSTDTEINMDMRKPSNPSDPDDEIPATTAPDPSNPAKDPANGTPGVDIGEGAVMDPAAQETTIKGGEGATKK